MEIQKAVMEQPAFQGLTVKGWGNRSVGRYITW